MKFLDPVLMKNEMKALQRHFKDKRDYVVGRFEQMGLGLKVCGYVCHTQEGSESFFLYMCVLIRGNGLVVCAGFDVLCES